MTRYFKRLVRTVLIPSLAIAVSHSLDAQAQRSGQPSVQDMLALRPTQRFVEYDTPSADQVATLKADLVTEGKAKIWVLRDAGGRTYRRFVDSDRDGVVDQWIYYKDGVEVYRDIDSNANRVADQFRWVNAGGTRWAVDANEDGKIDGYRILSCEEATREVLRALVLRDYVVMEAVLARPADAPMLGKLATGDRLKDLATRSRDQFTSLGTQLQHLTADSQWLRIESSIPMLIPGDAADGSRDIEVYRNVQAVIQTGTRVDVLQFGEIAMLGRTAKILEMPTVMAPRTPALAQTQTVFANVPADGPAVTDQTAEAQTKEQKEQQEIIAQLQKLDEGSAKAASNDAATVRYQLARAELLGKLAELAKTDDDRVEWLKQQADSLIAAVQISSSSDVRDRLTRFYDSVRSDAKGTLASYIAFRQISADYFRKLQGPGTDFAAIQKEWLENLQKFADEFPAAEDTPEALSQLAIGLEFTGKEDQARDYFQKLLDSFPDSAPAGRARGAIQRLGLVGKPFKFKASDLRRGSIDIEKFSGKVVLIDYWATTCDPWKTDLARLKEIYAKYHSKGFEIIGVSLDSDKADVAKFVQSAGITWPIAFENGGLESPLAMQYGILALPTQFLIDSKGEVVSRTIHTSQLEDELKNLLTK